MEKNRETTESIELDNDSNFNVTVNADLLQNEEIRNAEKNAVDKNNTSSQTGDKEVDRPDDSASQKPIDESDPTTQDEKKPTVDRVEKEEADKDSISEEVSSEDPLKGISKPDFTPDDNMTADHKVTNELDPEIEDTKEDDPGHKQDADAKPDTAENIQPIKAEQENEEDAENDDHDTHRENFDSKQDELDNLLHEDFSKCSKSELVDLIKRLSQSDNIFKVDKILNQIKPVFDQIKDSERREALDKFLEDGDNEDGFEFVSDEETNAFEATFRLLKDKKNKRRKDTEAEKEKNLVNAKEVLEKLRQFVDSDESISSFKIFKEIQAEWRNIGQLPNGQVKTLWANYSALLNLFYDHRSIYFELKELDRKKNLVAKLELCERAEKLGDELELKSAIMVLNDLHEEFKHIGPVPIDEQETLWQRFKTASDKVYARRKEFLVELKSRLQGNLTQKTKLLEEVATFVEFNSDRIKDWNEKTKEIKVIQKNWEEIRGLPKEKAKEINKQFWTIFKTFYKNKNSFFKILEKERSGNLKLKEELIEKVEALKDSTDWNATANEIKQFQKSWKEIGPVPERHRNKVFEKFREVCDIFFNNRRANIDDVEKKYAENLKSKKSIIETLNKLAKKGKSGKEDLEKLQNEYDEIGFVPKNSINSIGRKYQEAIQEFVESANLDSQVKEKIKIEVEFRGLKNDPNSEKKIFHKEQAIRKEIGSIENDIALWSNNLEFFADSQAANKLKVEFEKKIKKADDQLTGLKQQLKVLRTF